MTKPAMPPVEEVSNGTELVEAGTGAHLQVSVSDAQSSISCCASESRSETQDCQPNKSPTQRLTNKEAVLVMMNELKRHRMPLLVIGSILLCPFAIFLWTAIVLLWTGIEQIFPKLSARNQGSLRRLLPVKLTSADWFKELGEGVEQARPFVLAGTYFLCAPVAVIWMFVHWIRSLLGLQKNESPEESCRNPDSIFFLQNRKNVQSNEDEDNFFHSPVFGLTLLGIVASGLPALISYWLYFAFGVDAMLGQPSLDSRFQTVFLTIGLYLSSIGWCMSVLFFRAWFSFPLNFACEEQLVELNEVGIKKHELKGWFLTVLSFNRPSAGIERLNWLDVKELVYDGTRTIRLHPMPIYGSFNPNSLLYRFFNKLALGIDGVFDKVGRIENVVLTTGNNATDPKLSLRLWELNSEERARLFYAIRKWAPHVTANPETQEKLLGTCVISEPKYTELWFELLGSSKKRLRHNTLQTGDSLTQRELTIKRRIGSGGQASVYLAVSPSGEECALKEFVLSSGEAVGALVDSARDFENEVSLLSQVAHEGIVKLKDFFVEDRRAYIVLEHIEGQSIRECVRNHGRISEDQCIGMAIQMCRSLKYLHSLVPPVVHRDASPDNFIIRPDGNLVLIDFSLASGAELGRTTTTCMGKHGYTPPEQFQEEICPQSDIYALGATLSYMLVGADPKPLSRSSPRSSASNVSTELNAIVEKATELSLEQRYESIEWLLIELEQLSERLSPVS